MRLRNGRSLHFDSNNGCLGADAAKFRAVEAVDLVRAAGVASTWLAVFTDNAQGHWLVLLGGPRSPAPEADGCGAVFAFSRPQGSRLKAFFFLYGPVRAFALFIKVLERRPLPWPAMTEGGPARLNSAQLANVVGKAIDWRSRIGAPPRPLAWAEYIG